MAFTDQLHDAYSEVRQAEDRLLPHEVYDLIRDLDYASSLIGEKRGTPERLHGGYIIRAVREHLKGAPVGV